MVFPIKGFEMVDKPSLPTDYKSSEKKVEKVAKKVMSAPVPHRKKTIEDYPSEPYDLIFTFSDDEELPLVRTSSEREEVNFLEELFEELDGMAAIEITKIKNLLDRRASYSLIAEEWECFKNKFSGNLEGRAFERFDEFITDYREGRKSLEK